ncbi:MAG: cupin domain-containing protein [Acidimicrobiales bacterium]
MIIISPAQQAGITGKPGSQFTGAAYPYATMLATDGVVINTVNFTPSARTFWHHHEGGQIIFVLAGRGLIQADGGPVRTIRAGDTIWAPPGERHWHGGSSDSFMTHTAISLGPTSWAEEVSDEQFRAAASDGGE